MMCSAGQCKTLGPIMLTLILQSSTICILFVWHYIDVISCYFTVSGYFPHFLYHIHVCSCVSPYLKYLSHYLTCQNYTHSLKNNFKCYPFSQGFSNLLQLVKMATYMLALFPLRDVFCVPSSLIGLSSVTTSTNNII